MSFVTDLFYMNYTEFLKHDLNKWFLSCVVPSTDYAWSKYSFKNLNIHIMYKKQCFAFDESMFAKVLEKE